MHFVISAMLVKGDTVKHDKHCGSYNSRTADVKQLCRYCCYRMEDTDKLYLAVTPERKSPEIIQALVDSCDYAGLKNL